MTMDTSHLTSLYFDTPHAAVALNFKVASASLARAIIAAHHPQVEADLNSAHYPQGEDSNTVRSQNLCPKIKPFEREITLLLVRDPTDRFASACAERAIASVDDKLTQLEASWGRDPHFWPQSRLLQRRTRLYRFDNEQDLQALAQDAGLDWPLPDIAGTHQRPKPQLNAEQISRLGVLYAQDQSLFDAITSPGQLVEDTQAISLEFEQLKIRHLQALREKRQQVEQGGFEFGGRLFPSDRGTQAMIHAAMNAATNNPQFQTDWQLSDSEFVTLDAQTIIALANALQNHVAAAFANQAATARLILAATTLAQIESALIAHDPTT
jgi:hypothetical protein